MAAAEKRIPQLLAKVTVLERRREIEIPLAVELGKLEAELAWRQYVGNPLLMTLTILGLIRHQNESRPISGPTGGV